MSASDARPASPFTVANLKQVDVAGSGRAKLDEEIVELRQWDVQRIAPRVMRALESGPQGLELIAIGSDTREGEGGRAIKGFWSD